MIEYVWLIEEKVPGVVVNHGAFVSLVRYSAGGFGYEVLIENDDLEFYDGEDDDE